MDYRIELIRDFNAKTSWDLPDVISAFTNYRLILEQHGIKSSYPVLNFFCNWSAHVSLLKSDVGFSMIELFNEVIIDTFHLKVISQEDYFIKIRDTFSLNKLRADIFDVNKILKINHSVFKHSLYFNRVCDILIFTLLDREVAFPNDVLNGKKKNKYYQNVISYAKNHADFAAVSFKLSKDNIYKNMYSFIVELNGFDPNGKRWKYLIPYVPYHNSVYF